jgi:23S rRNA (adenine2503-C2)-methyltransferase
MDRMITELPQVNLAISLHAATDELRDELVPINRKWPLREVVAAGRRFAARTGRRVSLEYVMIDGLNDTDEQASRLATLARGWRSHVNLIPLNPTPGSRWSGTPRAGIDRFVATLRTGGVPTTVRDTRGREIEAACGQLHAQLSGRSLREARESAALPVASA